MSDETLLQQISALCVTNPGEPLSAPKIDHIGIAVHSIAASRKLYEMLGMEVTHEETIEHEQVSVAMLPAGESRLELLQPTAADSAVGRFLARRGEGLHHIAIKLPQIDEVFVRLRDGGIRMASDAVRTGAGRNRYFFIHPQSAGGVLLEIVGE